MVHRVRSIPAFTFFWNGIVNHFVVKMRTITPLGLFGFLFFFVFFMGGVGLQKSVQSKKFVHEMSYISLLLHSDINIRLRYLDLKRNFWISSGHYKLYLYRYLSPLILFNGRWFPLYFWHYVLYFRHMDVLLYYIYIIFQTKAQHIGVYLTLLMVY